MKITIIGAGNTAVAAACFLKTLGLSSLIYTCLLYTSPSPRD